MGLFLPSAERECLKRLGALQLTLGLFLAVVALARNGGLTLDVPVALSIAVTLSGAILFGAGVVGKGGAPARLLALLLEIGCLGAALPLEVHGVLQPSQWWDPSWLVLGIAFSLALNATTAPPLIALVGAISATIAGWQAGNALAAAAAGAAALAPAWAFLPVWRQAATAYYLPDGLARARSAASTNPLAADSGAPVPLGDADLRAAAAMLGVPALSLLIREPLKRSQGAWGMLHVLQHGEYRTYRVPLAETDADAEELGFVTPPGVHLRPPLQMKRLQGQSGELGRIIVGGSGLPLAGVPDVPDMLLALLAAWWSMRLDNRRLAADAEARLLDIVESLITSVEAKDRYTSGHSKRVCAYSELIAREMGIKGPELEEIAIGAALHDVGKLGIPDQVLGKPAKLDDKEWQQMRSHPKLGASIIDSFNQSYTVLHTILHHHEHWGGSGYPAGLAGEAIPLAARIVGVADALDAMTSARSYQRNRTLPDALEELRRCAGRQFDPAVVDAIYRIPLAKLEAIAPPAPVPVPAPVLAPAPEPVQPVAQPAPQAVELVAPVSAGRPVLALG